LDAFDFTVFLVLIAFSLQGTFAGAFVPPILTYFAIERGMGFGTPMLIGTVGGLVSFIITLFFSPETKGQHLVADLQIVPGE
jgi:hypothetical protein